MVLPSLEDGALPHGRWACVPSDIEAAFVRGLAPQREQIWNDWLQLTEVLRRLVGSVPAAWVSGSFLTDKMVPGDLDTLYIVDTAALQAAWADQANRGLLLTIANNRTKADLHLNVDSFILEWHPMPGADRTAPDHYYLNRGYWDDLWIRRRNSDPRLASVPRRGYVEVMLDGYR